MTPSARTRPPLARRTLIAFACAGIAFGCAAEVEPTYRGGRLDVAKLPPNDVAGAYLAAMGASFGLDEPGLSILVDPLLLPRSEGLAGGDSMPAAVRSALRRYRFVKGTCQVPVERNRTPLVCRAALPGYVVRFSAPFALGAGNDSVQVHLVAQQYAIPKGPVAERLRFERAYHLVRSGSRWRAVREGRLPQP
jgi:hypothetical protein